MNAAEVKAQARPAAIAESVREELEREDAEAGALKNCCTQNEVEAEGVVE